MIASGIYSKCISNHSLFWYFRDIYFVSIDKGWIFFKLYIFCTDNSFQFEPPHLVPIQILALHSVEWCGFLCLCHYNIVDMMTAYESFWGPLFLLHLRVNPFLNFNNVFWSASVKYAVYQQFIRAYSTSLFNTIL